VKLTTIIGTAIAASTLAACGATVPPTARPATPTVAPTPTATPAPTPTATPIATPTPAPKPKPGVTVTVTCSNVLDLGQFADTGYPPGSKLGTATWHGVKVGGSLQFGTDPQLIPITSNPFTSGAAVAAEFGYSLTQGTWEWDEVTQPPAYVEVAHGTFAIPACPGKTIR
jgi:hypothetical protein